jgi:ketosteroid isomerase-like protein
MFGMLAGIVLLLFVVAPNSFAQGVEESEHAVAGMPAQVDLPADLDRVLRDYEAAWRARDESALAALFTPDGFILRPGHPPVRGRTNIEKAYENSGGPLFLHAFEYAILDPVAYIIGGYGHAEAAPDSGKFILALTRLEDGQWYITADMDNSNH